ncbi:hypothetical protein ACFE04_021624 [Oxalis oulophora]
MVSIVVMESWFGVALVKHGGVLLFKGSRHEYDGGVSDELVLDSNKASYQEVKGFFTDKEFIEFGDCIRNNGEVSVFVAHGEGINIDHIPYNRGEDNANEKYLIDTANIDQPRCSARQTDEVLQASWGNLEDVELDDLHPGYEDIVDLDENGSSDSDKAYEDLKGQSDDSDDDELYYSRENLRKAAIDAKRRCENLGSVMKNLEKYELNREKMKGKCVEDPNNELDNDVGSEDNYDIESDGEREVHRRRRSSICNLIGHNKLSCPDRTNPTEKPPRKPRTKKTTDEGISSAPTDQPLRQHRKRIPTTDVIDTVIDTTVDVIDQPTRKCHTRNNVEQGTSSQPVTLNILVIVDEMVVQNKEDHRAAEAVLEEVNRGFVELTRSLIEKEKNPPDLGFSSKVVIIDKSTGKMIFNPGTKSQFEILSNPHKTIATQWYGDLAPPPLPKDHAQFKSTLLMYHDPQGKKGLTKMLTKRGGSSGSTSRGGKTVARKRGVSMQ